MARNNATTRRRTRSWHPGVHPPILGVDLAGRPYDWLGWEEAVRHYVLKQVAWTVGEPRIIILGGHNRAGERSSLPLHPVISVRGANAVGLDDQVPTLSGRALFARDRNTCLYCGEVFPTRQLTFDHIVPKSRRGRNIWTNAATSCRRCNHHKDDRTPEEAGMPLLAVPYEPNHAENLILSNRLILADQMAFLRARVPQSRRDLY